MTRPSGPTERRSRNASIRLTIAMSVEHGGQEDGTEEISAVARSCDADAEGDHEADADDAVKPFTTRLVLDGRHSSQSRLRRIR